LASIIRNRADYDNFMIKTTRSSFQFMKSVLGVSSGFFVCSAESKKKTIFSCLRYAYNLWLRYELT